MNKTALSVLALVLVAVLPAPSLAQSVQLAPVVAEPVQETVHLDGVIEAVQQSTISAQTSGTVVALPVDVDDSVAAGDLIVRLDDTEQRARLSQARASVEEAVSGLQDAQQQFDRVEAIYERRLVSRQEFDRALNSLNAAQARVERARAAVDEAREQLDYTRITAPYGGIVTERHVEIGEAVNPGQPLISGLSLEQLRVVVDLPQQYADMARKQRQATVTLSDGRVLQTGDMTFYPYASLDTHTFRLRLQLNEPNGTLFPGMLVKVEVPVASRDSLWIPASALVRRSELRAVFVMNDQDQPRLRQIRTGVSHGDRLEVLSGLGEGEQVVSNPATLVGSEQLALPGDQSGEE
ncbi:efflux RND transporter periplasmic adaptor subunit [Marinobacter oulmenensis]|uniref:RND family efflux transporter MFP subunit n=1 Tax=Marinobacter oulmenensis TaxID=643747 RepID=A0A840U5N9_9GAMM|nr:efflux RND transporter periplasmic adaptor subunit [Marinobacter oulmenensis]MBB5321024.1 RND family efflux transporter MFP subunit [Marinobacter oulmenensis]